MRLIDADVLMAYCNNQTEKTIAANDIARFPAVDAAPVVHGEWIGYYEEHVPLTNGIPAGSCFCSICSAWLVAPDEYGTPGYYCPNCGAKMDLK